MSLELLLLLEVVVLLSLVQEETVELVLVNALSPNDSKTITGT